MEGSGTLTHGKVAPAGVETPLGIVSYLKVFALINYKAALSLSLGRIINPWKVPRHITYKTTDGGRKR